MKRRGLKWKDFYHPGKWREREKKCCVFKKLKRSCLHRLDRTIQLRLSLNIPTGPWQMRQIKTAKEQILLSVCATELLYILGGSCDVLPLFPSHFHVPPEEEPTVLPVCWRQDHRRRDDMYPFSTGHDPLVLCWRVNAYRYQSGPHIWPPVCVFVCVCTLYTLLYCAYTKRERDFLTWKRHIEGGNDCVGLCVAFFLFLLRVREEDPLSLGRRRRPSWAGSSSYFSCPCVGKHRDIPTGEKRKEKDRTSQSSPRSCLISLSSSLPK